MVTRWPGPVLVAALLLALPALSACEDAEVSRDGDRYVALGDSFTSGAGLPRTSQDPLKCARSPLNYPHLVAKAIGAKLEDVSCGGATTDNGAKPQPLGPADWPPQLDAVTKGTDLVTVGLGGNDFSWFLTVMFSCTSAAGADPTGSPCEQQGTSPATNLTAVPPQIGARVEALLREVHRKAPGATVLLVGYPQPVPAEGTCADLPLAAGDYAFVREQWEALDAAMRDAASAAGSTYVDVMGPSEGHDICAGEDAWVNGFRAKPGGAAAYHPLVSGQAGVAKLVEDALEE